MADPAYIQRLRRMLDKPAFGTRADPMTHVYVHDLRAALVERDDLFHRIDEQNDERINQVDLLTQTIKTVTAERDAQTACLDAAVRMRDQLRELCYWVEGLDEFDAAWERLEGARRG